MNEPEVVDVREFVDAYVRASKGSKERAFLMALDAGYDFNRVVGAFGEPGIRVAFQLLLKGHINCGTITEVGRAELRKGADA